MANGHGGARKGAGRKPIADRHPEVKAALEQRLAAGALDRVAALELLAEGGLEEIEEVYEPAGLIYVGAGEARSLAFPHLPPEQLVCVRRVRRVAGPDRKANEYLLDRFAGRPVQAIDGEMQLSAADDLIAAFGAAVAKIYGDASDGA